MTTTDHAALAAHLPEPFREPFGAWFSLAVEHEKARHRTGVIGARQDGIEALRARLRDRGFPTRPAAAWALYRLLDALPEVLLQEQPDTSDDLANDALAALCVCASRVIREAEGGTVADAMARVEALRAHLSGCEPAYDDPFRCMCDQLAADIAALAKGGAHGR